MANVTFRYTILYVEDVLETLAFYEAAFGLQKGFLHPSGDYGELITGETKLAFSSRTLMRSLGKTPAEATPNSPVFEIALETDDVTASLSAALASGATLIQKARVEAWGQTVAYVADPNGYLVEICSPIPASEDA